MKTILLQLDSDPQPSPFDAIAALDAGVDELLRHGGVTPGDAAELVQSAMFPRGPQGAASTAVWIGGSRAPDGERLLEAVREVLFDPFRLSVMIDSDGCNTTAAAAVARLRGGVELAGAEALVVGAGPVGLRCAELAQREGARVAVAGLPPDLFPGRPHRRAAGLALAEQRGWPVVEPQDSAALAARLAHADVAFVAAPAGVRVLPQDAWAQASLRALVDFGAAEPVGVQGVGRDDDLVERHGALVLGALAVGAPKMRLQRACVRRLFAEPGALLDLDAIYRVALELA